MGVRADNCFAASTALDLQGLVQMCEKKKKSKEKKKKKKKEKRLVKYTISWLTKNA